MRKFLNPFQEVCAQQADTVLSGAHVKHKILGMDLGIYVLNFLNKQHDPSNFMTQYAVSRTVSLSPE